MATLSFDTTTEEFSQLLLEMFGIEDNDISVERPEAAPTREEGR